ncbi:MAG: L,D-transpeptidase family protein [Propionibacteriales bacterium]|nr:L,D-transpeptidase family protein [Propionibacteriales bacterium]
MGRRTVIGFGAVALAGAVLAAGYAAYGTDLLGDEPAAAAPQAPESTRPAAPTPTPTPAPTADPVRLTPAPLLEPRDTGEKVRELQARLQQIAWYTSWSISGEYDRETERAVAGFQAKRGISKTGVVDRQTWRRLLTMTRTPTHAEMHNKLEPGPTILGPDDSGRKVRELQARLKQIAWFSEEVTGHYGDVTRTAVTGFQLKRGIPSTGEVDQRTWNRLLGMTRTPTGDELFNRYSTGSTTGPLDPRCLTGSVLCIDKSTNSLRWVVDGRVRMTFDVRFGSELTPTREGAFQVNFKSRDHVSSLYDTPMPFAMFFSGGQAVHYSPDFAANGYNGASHGCVNVRDYGGIAALYAQVDVGDPVIVYWS